MKENKKLALMILGVILAFSLTHVLFWYLVPYRTYQSYEGSMPEKIETEITYPTIFGLRGRIRMYVNPYSALEIVPGVFGGSELYAVFAGMTEEYRIAVDDEMIPLEPVNEECEILLDEVRAYLIEYRTWARENWDIE